MSNDHSTAHIYQSLVGNVVIASVKGVAAFFTGSGAMLAETIHTSADCVNQVLLLLGVKASVKPPDRKHPLGYGRNLYFWSFLVALLLFTGGGVFSIYEGIHKMAEPEPLEYVGLGLGILAFSLLIEGAATFSNVKEMNKRREGKSFFKYLRETKDSDLIVVFGENSAATLGLLFAAGSLILSWYTGNPKWDGLGSLLIGLVLVAVAIFLATEVKSLLVGESADSLIEDNVRQVVAEFPDKITHLLHLLAVQQGPGQVLLMMKLGFKADLDVGVVCDTINQFEEALRKRCPEVRWSFIEPDRPRN